MPSNPWLGAVKRVLALSQTGLAFQPNDYDRERYEEIRQISLDLLAHMSNAPVEQIMSLLPNDVGYITPKVDVRAVLFNAGQILMVQEKIDNDRWTLPGGGLDHGEDPRDAVVREVREETGLDAAIGETARVYSAHLPGVWRDGRRVDAHALRIVYEGWVPVDAPPPHVVEVGGSTMAAAWHPVEAVLDGAAPAVPMVLEALADHRPFRHQRLGAYALMRLVKREYERVNEELEAARLTPVVNKAEREGHPTLRRDPRTGVYRP